MLFGSSKVRDDRGRTRSVSVPGQTVKARRRERLEARRERHAALIAKRDGTKTPRPPSKLAKLALCPVYAVVGIAGLAAVMAFFGVCVAAACLPMVGLARLLSWPTEAGVLATVVVGVIVLVVLAIRGQKAANDRGARDLVRLGLCGACGYDLAGLEPGPDDCVECPECGSAWKPNTSVEFMCPECGEELESLAVVEPGVARCFSCNTKFDFRVQSTGVSEANDPPPPS